MVGNENLDVDEEEGDHKRKIVLKKRSIQKIVTLPNGTTFTARCERISRKQLPSNIRVYPLSWSFYCKFQKRIKKNFFHNFKFHLLQTSGG